MRFEDFEQGARVAVLLALGIAALVFAVASKKATEYLERECAPCTLNHYPLCEREHVEAKKGVVR